MEPIPLVRLSLRYHLVVIVSLFLEVAVFAQPDHCQVQVDKSFYVPGEVIWYRLWLPAAYEKQPVAAQVEVFLPGGGLVRQFFLRVEAGVADGYFRLPYDWSSGIYRFRFVASVLPEGERLELATIELPVFSDRKSDSKVSELPGMAASANDQQLTVVVTPEREVYSPRDSVRLVVEVRDARGRPVAAQLAVSVTDYELCGPQVYPGPVLFTGPALPTERALDSLLFLEGAVRDSDGRPFSSPLLTAWVSPPGSGSIVTVDTPGTFRARLPLFWGEGSVQLFDYKQEGLQVTATTAPSLPPASPLRYTEGVRGYLESSRQRKIVYQLFDTLEMVPRLLQVPQEAPRHDPDRRMIPAEYEGLETAADFFRELPSQLNMRERQGRYTARMFNPAPHMKKDYGGPALFIVDGHLTRDADFVAALKLADIATFDLYFDYARLREYFGAIGRYGVVYIRTKTGEIALPEADRRNFISLNGLLPPAAFPSTVVHGEEGDLPGFRPLVFWGGAATDSSGRVKLGFPLGDDLSVFRILVAARNSRGAMGVGEKVVRVAFNGTR